MNEPNQDRIRHQFGQSAADYAASEVHSDGESLQLLCDLIDAQPDWAVLDIAAGAGYAGLAFAPRVSEVIATDITEPMLEQTRILAKQRGFANVSTLNAAASKLPFADASFDLALCRLAMHHFTGQAKAANEMFRVLRPGGILGFTDNVVVDNPAAAEIYNRFESIRDPSHGRVLSQHALQSLLTDAGFRIDTTRRLTKELEFHAWADRQRVSVADKKRLLNIMREIPDELVPLFQPRWADDTMYFSLWELVVVATAA